MSHSVAGQVLEAREVRSGRLAGYLPPVGEAHLPVTGVLHPREYRLCLSAPVYTVIETKPGCLGLFIFTTGETLDFCPMS